jgi:hypothetical protein
VDRVLADWFGLLRRGRRITAVGNSDTHAIDASFAGYPRNYVRVGETAAEVDGLRLAAALREGRSFFSSGPFVEADIGGKSYGELVEVSGGAARLRVKISAAPWVSVSRLRVYVDGDVAKDVPIEPSTRALRHAAEHELALAADAFVVVRVDGERSLAPVAGGAQRATLMPLAVGNPIYVDADGDGKYGPKPR